MTMDVGKQKDFQELLLESYSGNQDAVDAGLYFIAFYEEWGEISKSLSPDDSVILDRAVCQVLNGESHKASSPFNVLAENIFLKSKPNALRLFRLITSLMSGEILSNKFVAEHRLQIGSAIFNDAMNETASRVTNGRIRTVAKSNRWNVLSAIAGITSGADEAIRINIALKNLFGEEENGRSIS